MNGAVDKEALQSFTIVNKRNDDEADALQIDAKAPKRNEEALHNAAIAAKDNEALQYATIVAKRNEVNRYGCHTNEAITDFLIKQAKRYAQDVLHFANYGDDSSYCPVCHSRMWSLDKHCSTCPPLCVVCGNVCAANSYYCSNACRQKAYRRRNKEARA